MWNTLFNEKELLSTDDDTDIIQPYYNHVPITPSSYYYGCCIHLTGLSPITQSQFPIHSLVTPTFLNPCNETFLCPPLCLPPPVCCFYPPMQLKAAVRRPSCSNLATSTIYSHLSAHLRYIRLLPPHQFHHNLSHLGASVQDAHLSSINGIRIDCFSRYYWPVKESLWAQKQDLTFSSIHNFQFSSQKRLTWFYA